MSNILRDPTGFLGVGDTYGESPIGRYEQMVMGSELTELGKTIFFFF